MSELHLRQIKAFLKSNYETIIDTSDITNTSEIDNNFFTRANAAFSIMHNANTTHEIAAQSITDGYRDNGIDAIYFDTNNYILYLVQSKWSNDGSGSIDREGIQKFIKGVKDLINARFERFNSKVQAKQTTINRALDDSRIKISLILSYTGSHVIHQDILQDMKDFLDEINDPTELVTFKSERQRDIYNSISLGTTGAPINIDVSISEWGQIREPYQAFYGQVAASDIVGWYESFQSRLFDPNIRVFLGDTTVNENIISSVQNEAQNIFYFNNGITALCSSIRKKPIGGNSRESGIFEISDLKIVNGAQTVGSLSKAKIDYPAEIENAKIIVRFISLENCPDGFERNVTRYNNTQNRIDRRDFVALDPEQERIKMELLLENIDYVYKSGERVINYNNGFDLVDATIALACSNNRVELCVQAKREIGKLWDDIERAPYKLLFNGSTQGPKLWRLVRIQRVVDEFLDEKSRELDGRERLIAIHGNRMVSHKLFAVLEESTINNLNGLTSDEVQEIKTKVETILNSVTQKCEELYPDSYPQSIFKNLSKCREIANYL